MSDDKDVALEEVLKRDSESNLTPREEKFLEVLFTEAKGDVDYAMKLAGFGSTDSKAVTIKKLYKEIQKRSQEFIAASTPQAIIHLLSLFHEPNTPGSKTIIAAAKEVLDRGGVVKEDVTSAENNITAKNVFILPAKDKDTDA